MEFLEVYVNVKASTTKQWQRQNVLHHRALLSLAVYESFTAEEARGRMEEFIQQYEEKMEGVKTGDQDDPLGNTLVESARKLSGTGEQKKPKKPKALTPKKVKQQKAKKRGPQPAKKILDSTAKRGTRKKDDKLDNAKSTSTASRKRT